MSKLEIVEKIKQLYGETFLHQSALRLRDGAKRIDGLIGNRRYSTIVEIGTFNGVTSAFLSQYCDTLVTIDINESQVETRRQLWENLGINNIIPYTIRNDEEKKDILKNYDYDLVFIDGGHSYDEVKFDYELTCKCGRVLFHDYGHIAKEGAMRLNNPVKKFIDTLPQDEIKTDDIFALWIKK